MPERDPNLIEVVDAGHALHELVENLLASVLRRAHVYNHLFQLVHRHAQQHRPLRRAATCACAGGVALRGSNELAVELAPGTCRAQYLVSAYLSSSRAGRHTLLRGCKCACRRGSISALIKHAATSPCMTHCRARGRRCQIIGGSLAQVALMCGVTCCNFAAAGYTKNELCHSCGQVASTCTDSDERTVPHARLTRHVRRVASV